MLTQRSAIFALLAASFAALPLASANAQYANSCAFPLAWPFCIAGAAVNTAAAIATAPFQVVAGGPYYYYPQPYYAPYAPVVYAAPVHHHHHKKHHPVPVQQ